MENVRDVSAVLDELGISPVDQDRNPDLYTELFRVARRVRESGRQIIGLLPTNEKTAVLPAALQLGFVLADACDGMVALVDANTQLPALTRLASPQERKEAPTGFATTWAADFFAVLTPVTKSESGLAVDVLEHNLREGCEGFVHVLVDLTGFERLGEHWATYDSLDGVLVFGHPGLTSEREVFRLMREIPASHRLGFLLVG